MKRMKTVFVAFVLIIGLLATGCQKLPDVGSAEITPNEWQLILDSSKNTTLNVYLDMTDSASKAWLESVMVPYMKDALGVEVRLNALNTTNMIATLKNQKTNEISMGSADMLLLSKRGFNQLKAAGVLYGPFTNKLPNAANNQSADSYENSWFDGAKIENTAVNLGKNQLVFYYDEDKMPTPPTTLNDLKNYIKANPGKFVLPSLDTQEGQAFVYTLAASLCDQKKLYETTMTPAQLNQFFAPVVAFLNEIKPALYMQGANPPRNIAEVDKLFMAGTVDFSVSLDQNKAVRMIKENKFPDGAKAYVLSSGTTGFNFYGVIPFNSANKSGAMAVLNEMLSGTIQGSKYDSKNWGNLPSVDPMKMDKDSSALITKVIVKRSGLKESDLSAARLPQVPNDKAYQLIVFLKGLGYQ